MFVQVKELFKCPEVLCFSLEPHQTDKCVSRLKDWA